MSRLKFLMVATVAAAAALFAPAKSEAALTVVIKDGANTTTLTDGDNDGLIQTTAATNATTGGIVVGGYRIGLTSSFTPGSFSSDLTTNTTLKVFRTGGAISGPLEITVMEDNLTTPTAGPSGLLNLLNSLTLLQVGGSGSQVSAVTTASNIPAGPGDPKSTSAVTLSALGSGDSDTTFAQTTNPYSLKQVFTVTLGSGGSANFSGSGSVNAAPAPAGLVMLATALPFAGLLRRRLRKSEVATAA
ncbi:hypothetical protein VT84_25290 [Gemmata sp. SH-PL17]|uniref:hypothetical protein n=1 Tax=Gemmata sp. SH-PL17 TaxID=1630693 RepID=UPI00078DF974|nr:hypothetical protein [Gemmata sp. SH-PL17]AMV27741.1 hypothetical protein VT84_25290 [Gemmata sp. SH-PL17]